MKTLWYLLFLACGVAFGQTPGFNYYVPASGVQFNTGATAINSAATAAQIAATFNGASGCTGAAALLYNATCGVLGTVTSVAITAPSPLGVDAGCSGTSIINCAITWTTGQTANLFLATPNGSTGAVGLRAIVAADVPILNQPTTANAGTATALAAVPSQCSGSTFATGIQASGAANCSTPAGGGNVSNSGTPTSGQFAEWTGATTLAGETLGGDCTLATATITCTKTSGSVFGTLATQNAPTGVSNQCLQANSAGTVTGTGAGCGGSSSGANPTASVGLSTVNGSATTYMRSDGAPALSQSISPTMTGAWTWTNTTSGGVTPATATWAESFHLNDQQGGGHSYGDIAGYCSGAAAGTWGVYDYTANISRFCINSSGVAVLMPPISSYLESGGLYDYPSSAPTLTTHAGYVGTPVFETFVGFNLSWNGANWVSGTDGGSNGGALITANHGSGTMCIRTIFPTGGTFQVIPNGSLPACALAIDANQNISAPGAASVPWPTYSTGSITLTYSSGCTTGSFAPTMYWTKIGNVVTFKLSPSSCNATSGTIVASGIPSAIAPASNTGVASIIEANSMQAVGMVLIAGSPTNTLTISTITSGATGTANTNETSGSYTLN